MNLSMSWTQWPLWVSSNVGYSVILLSFHILIDVASLNTVFNYMNAGYVFQRIPVLFIAEDCSIYGPCLIQFTLAKFCCEQLMPNRWNSRANTKDRDGGGGSTPGTPDVHTGACAGPHAGVCEYFLKKMWPVESRGKAWVGRTGREKLLYTDHNPLSLCTTQRCDTACPTWCLVWMRCLDCESGEERCFYVLVSRYPNLF